MVQKYEIKQDKHKKYNDLKEEKENRHGLTS